MQPAPAASSRSYLNNKPSRAAETTEGYQPFQSLLLLPAPCAAVSATYQADRFSLMAPVTTGRVPGLPSPSSSSFALLCALHPLAANKGAAQSPLQPLHTDPELGACFPGWPGAMNIPSIASLLFQLGISRHAAASAPVGWQQIISLGSAGAWSPLLPPQVSCQYTQGLSTEL